MRADEVRFAFGTSISEREPLATPVSKRANVN